MAATQTPPELVAAQGTANQTDLLISLCPLSPDSFHLTLANLATAFPDQTVLVATPDAAPGHHAASATESLRILPYTPSAPTSGSWILTAADFLNTWKLVEEHHASAAVILGADAHTLHPDAIRNLATAALSADLVTPHYDLGPRDGLVNASILYPVTRALFGTRPRYPLAIDLGVSARMSERLATVAQRYTASGLNTAFLWPVSEAAAAGMTIAEVPAGPRGLPPPDAADLNTLLAQIAGSLFAEVDTKATFWQRARLAYSPKQAAAQTDAAQGAAHPDAASTEETIVAEAQPMLDSFRLAYSNLHEIWSLVLPPNSLLGLKKLSILSPAAFRMPDALWVRIVYDFILAYRLRTINRGHLLGALTPLYLAWVASHVLLTSGSGHEPVAPEKHIEALAAAFEADKPYLVSRWRWPDRFNP
ncbi:MAG: hypothetical protein NVSMB62_23610 [Acidobacteriaceae bacterium]